MEFWSFNTVTGIRLSATLCLGTRVAIGLTDHFLKTSPKNRSGGRLQWFSELKFTPSNTLSALATQGFRGFEAKHENLPSNWVDFRLSLYHSITVFHPLVNHNFHINQSIPLPLSLPRKKTAANGSPLTTVTLCNYNAVVPVLPQAKLPLGVSTRREIYAHRLLVN